MTSPFRRTLGSSGRLARLSCKTYRTFYKLQFMADIDRLAPVRKDLQKLFVTAVEENLADLEQANITGRLETVAWLSRNLLELSTWIVYCLQSEMNAKQFVLDSARDANDAIKIPVEVFGYSFEQAQQQNRSNAELYGFETLDDKYTRVISAAEKLGKKKQFVVTNKLLSKFAHPTAMAIVGKGTPAASLLKSRFYTLGKTLGDGALTYLRDYHQVD